MALRYQLLAHEIERIGAKRIVEIGTCKGDRAELMICAALSSCHLHNLIEYYGFDMFEPPPEHELSGKCQPWPMWRVAERLSRYGVKAQLTAGRSEITVPACALKDIDLVFIDGGHSEATIKADFDNALKMLRRGGSIMLDDYWDYPEGGCNSLVDGLDRSRFDVTILEPADVFAKPYGSLTTQIVRVIPH